MLLVVLGAGASSDYVMAGSLPIDELLRPPLTDGLVADSAPNRVMLANIPSRAASALVAALRIRVASLESLEDALDTIAAVEGDVTRELVAFRLYLQSLLGRVSAEGVTEVGGVTNQALMVRRIEHWRRRAQPDEPVLYVTFNYDTILDQALASEYQWTKVRHTAAIDDYITRPPFRLIKLHGSVNWGNQTTVITPWRASVDQITGLDVAWNAKVALLDAAYRELLDVQSSRFELMPEFGLNGSDWVTSVDKEERFLLPAIAVPVGTKAAYVCPDSHVREMREWLPKVDRILTIGWKAGEPDFVRDLAAVRPDALVHVVSRSIKTRQHVFNVLKGTQPGLWLTPVGSGGHRERAFTDLVSGSELDEFLEIRGPVNPVSTSSNLRY